MAINAENAIIYANKVYFDYKGITEAGLDKVEYFYYQS